VKTIGIDEISYCKGHKYATLVYDLDRSVVLWVGEGKGRTTIDKFFSLISAARASGSRPAAITSPIKV
jgi:transposase